MTARMSAGIRPSVVCRKATEAQRIRARGSVGIAAGGMVGVGEQRLPGAAGEQRFEAGAALLDPFLERRAMLSSASFQRNSGLAGGTATAPTR